MAKTLHLLRHAKSSWSDKGLDDEARPLNKRGKQSCELMADILSKRNCSPECVLVSPAKRAKSTIKRIAQQSPKVCSEWIVDERLYTFAVQDLVTFIQGLGDDVNDVMLVGHNPGFTDLINELCAVGLDNLPTCGYIQMRLDIDSWSAAGDRCGKVTEQLFPKMFEE